jgi:hypothetical protein
MALAKQLQDNFVDVITGERAKIISLEEGCKALWGKNIAQNGVFKSRSSI